jgi:hypothetical protein
MHQWKREFPLNDATIMPFLGNQLQEIGECIIEDYLLGHSTVQIHTR